MLCGCSVKTTITLPDESVYSIKSKSDAIVSYKNKDVEITVDNRGNRSGFELLFPAILNKSPDVVIGDTN